MVEQIHQSKWRNNSMKKIILFVAALALFISCNKEKLQESESTETVPVTVCASFPETKATIGAMAWEIGDQITVWVASHLNDEGYNGNVLDLVDATTGKFAGEIATPQAEDTYYAAYGADGFNRDFHTPVFNLSATQADASNGATKARLSGIYEGALSDLSFTMSAATAKLKISFDKEVKRVTFAGMKGENIIGENKEVVFTDTKASGTKDVEFIIPSMTFFNGYKLTVEGMTVGQVMYLAFPGQKVFSAGYVRNVSINFVPFSISAAFDEANSPMTSYSYYLKGDYSTANSDVFETGGRLGEGSNADAYDDDVRGVFTGKLQGGKAKIVINGASASLIPEGYKVKEYGYYRSVNGSTPEQIKVGVNLDEPLSKNISWDVEGNNTNYTLYDQGVVSLQPYIIVNYGGGNAEYRMEQPKDFYITGLPHISAHKDLWHVAAKVSHTDIASNKVTGEVINDKDEKHENVDMFYNNNADGGWDDFCVRTRPFSIPSGQTVNVKPVLYGVLWGGNHAMEAYFYFDSTNNDKETYDGSTLLSKGYVFHRTAPHGHASDIKTDSDAYIESSKANESAYSILGNVTKTGFESHINNDVVVLNNTDNEFNMYLWIHRHSGVILSSYHPGYWLKNIRVQYSAPANN